MDRVVISLGSVPQRATAGWDGGCSVASRGAALIPTPTSRTDPSASHPHQLWVLSLFVTVSTERQQWPLVSGMGVVGACGPLSAVFCPFCDWKVRAFAVGLPDLLLNFVSCGVCRRVSQLQPPSHLPNGVFCQTTVFHSDMVRFAGEAGQVCCAVAVREPGCLCLFGSSLIFLSAFFNVLPTVLYTSGRVYT